MLRPRFYIAQALAQNTTLVLEKEPSRHIAKVLRMRVGEALCLFDGCGNEVAATISAVDRDHVAVSTTTLRRVDRESPLNITLAVSISRGDRMDITVQKATELGVAKIWPFVSERTGVRLKGERLAKKNAHWQGVAASACEQSGRNLIPALGSVCSFDEVLAKTQAAKPDAALILHPGVEKNTLPATVASLALLVGPEGGFSDGEIQRACNAGFLPVQLGPRVLRTETAPLAAISVAQARWGDFGATI